jgi:hypothetical protein
MSAPDTSSEPVPGRSRRATLVEHFACIEDPRDVRRILHPLREVLLLVVCITIADCGDYDAIVCSSAGAVRFRRSLRRRAVTPRRHDSDHTAPPPKLVPAKARGVRLSRRRPGQGRQGGTLR